MSEKVWVSLPDMSRVGMLSTAVDISLRKYPITKPPPTGYRFGWKTSAVLGYADPGHEVAVGVATEASDAVEVFVVASVGSQGFGAFGSSDTG